MIDGDNVKKGERKKRSGHVLVNYAAVGTVRRAKKRGKSTGTIVWIKGYGPVDVASVYSRCTGFIIIFRARLLYRREKKRTENGAPTKSSEV